MVSRRTGHTTMTGGKIDDARGVNVVSVGVSVSKSRTMTWGAKTQTELYHTKAMAAEVKARKHKCVTTNLHACRVVINTSDCLAIKSPVVKSYHGRFLRPQLQLRSHMCMYPCASGEWRRPRNPANGDGACASRQPCPTPPTKIHSKIPKNSKPQITTP